MPLLLYLIKNNTYFIKYRSKGNQEERTHRQLFEDRMYGCQLKDQPKIQGMNRRCQNQASTEVHRHKKCFNRQREI